MVISPDECCSHCTYVLYFTVLYCTGLHCDNDVVRLDTGEDQRVDKEEFTSDKMKETLEKVTRSRSRIF